MSDETIQAPRPALPSGPFLTTAQVVADVADVPLSEVLLAIETGELPVIRGSETLISRRAAQAWVDDRRPVPVEAPVPEVPRPADGPVVDPLTGKVRHEVTVDMETGRPIR